LFGGGAVNYTVAPSADGSFIVIKACGDITRRDASQISLEAHALGKQLRINHYLVDVTEARNIDPIMENYRFAYSDLANADGITRLEFVAVLVSPDDHSHDFAETVCRNAGFNITIFRDPVEARQALVRIKLREETHRGGKKRDKGSADGVGRK